MHCWRSLACFIVIAGLTWPNLGCSRPETEEKGPPLRRVNVPAGSPGELVEKITIQTGGVRTCIIVQGDHDPVVDVGIEVYDDKKRLVAKDEGKGELAAVIWYPPEGGDYTVVIKNPNNRNNLCYFVIR